MELDMKKRFTTFGLVLLVLLSSSMFITCDDDKDNSSTPTGPDLSCWPADLPQFGYGDLFSIICDEGVFKTAVFNTIANPETAYNNYKTALSNSGWIFNVDTSNDSFWGAAFIKDEKGATVSIQKDGTVAQVFYFDD
jgi:hypothetical protein